MAQTPYEQLPLNKKKWWAWISLLICSFGPSSVKVTGKCATLNLMSFGCGIVLENPSFISCYHLLQEVGLTCHMFQEFLRNQHTIVLLFILQILWGQFSANFSICRSFVMIQWTSVFGSPTSTAINRTFKCQSLSRTAFTRATFFSVLEVEGSPVCCSSSTLSLPSLNTLCHLKTWAEDKTASP